MSKRYINESVFGRTDVANNVVLTKEDNVSGRSLINWVNDLLKCDIKTVDELCTGSIYCQLMHSLFPLTIPMHKVRLVSNIEFEYVINYKILQAAFERTGIVKDIPVGNLINGKGNHEFLQWFHKFFKANNHKQYYDAHAARFNLPIGLGKSHTWKPCVRLPSLSKKYEDLPAINDGRKLTGSKKYLDKMRVRSRSAMTSCSCFRINSEIESGADNKLPRRRRSLHSIDNPAQRLKAVTLIRKGLSDDPCLEGRASHMPDTRLRPYEETGHQFENDELSRPRTRRQSVTHDNETSGHAKENRLIDSNSTDNALLRRVDRAISRAPFEVNGLVVKLHRLISGEPVHDEMSDDTYIS